MFFSAHVVDTNLVKAITRRTPRPEKVPGLKSARNGIAAPFTTGALPRPQLGRETLVACWEDESALDGFLANHPFGEAIATGWTARMELVRSVGIWPGLTDDMDAEAGDKSRDMTGPSIAVTIGTAYLRTVKPFLQVNNGLEKQFLTAPGARWGTAFSNIPQRLVATLSVWDDSSSAQGYMRKGAHGQAMRDHYDPKKDPTGHTFVTGGGFFGFRPLSTTGSLGGKNPIPNALLPA